MQIHSIFRDYYDGVVRQFDPTPTPFWHRVTRVESVPRPPGVKKKRVGDSSSFRTLSSTVRWEDPFGPLYDLWAAIPTPALGDGTSDGPVIDHALVVVCGRVFPVYHWSKLGLYWLGPKSLLASVESGELARSIVEDSLKDQFPAEAAARACWGFRREGYTPLWIKRHLLLDFGLETPDSTERKSRRFRYGDMALNPKTAEAFEALIASRPTVDEQVHAHPLVRSPVFAVRHTDPRRCSEACLEIDPNLGALGMASFLPPREAWQLLDRAFNGPLSASPEVPSTTGGDEILRDAKGFDEWSFKRHRDDPKPARAKK